MRQFISNIDDGVVHIAKWIESIAREYPNPNKMNELFLCDDKLEFVKIIREENEGETFLQFVKNKTLPTMILIYQNGTFEEIEDTTSSLNVLDKVKLNNVWFEGKITKYKSPIKISVITRSLVACKTLSLYLASIIKKTKSIKYPAFVIDNKEMVGIVENYMEIFFSLSTPLAFTEEPMEEGYYRLSLEFEFIDSYLFFKEFIEDSNKTFDIEFTLGVSNEADS